MTNSGLKVRGYAELSRLIAKTSKESRKDFRDGMREIAEPIRRDAEQLATSGIRRIGPKWGKMRVGVTHRAVYVAPRQRGVKGRGVDSRRRPKFADLMEQRAMTPALERNKANIERRVEAVFADLSRKWNRAS